MPEKRTEKSMKKYRRIFLRTGLILGTILLILTGIRSWQDRRYNLISVMIAFLACFCVYLTYEKREGSIRRMVLLAVMVAIAVTGRFLFAPLPFFKPVTAIVILTGMYLGAEAGFLVGSLTALISNIFFGQGPWTPFQMLAWGTIGMAAGLPIVSNLLKKKWALILYGVLTGFLYSGIMDFWTVLSMDGGWNWSRYLAALAAALPVTVIYAVSNAIFLIMTWKPIGEKLNRIQKKHGIF